MMKGLCDLSVTFYVCNWKNNYYNTVSRNSRLVSSPISSQNTLSFHAY